MNDDAANYSVIAPPPPTPISHIYYHDAYQIYELFDKKSTKYGYDLGLDSMAMKELFIRIPSESKREFLYGQTLLHKCFESLSWTGTTKTTAYTTQRDVVNILLDAYPEALTKEDDNGYLPIHCLLLPPPTCTTSSLTRSNNYYYIKELLPQICLAFPDSISAKTKIGGQLPLHIVCQRTSDIGSETENESIETESDTTTSNSNSNSNSNSDSNSNKKTTYPLLHLNRKNKEPKRKEYKERTKNHQDSRKRRYYIITILLILSSSFSVILSTLHLYLNK